MVDPSVVFIDGTHIKASANKKKFQKERVAQTAKIYSEQLRQEVNAEREKLAKDPIEDEDDDDTPKGGTKEQTVSTLLPYTRYNGKKDRYKPWEYTYDPVKDEYICPQGERLRHTTTDRNGKRSYRSTPERCRNCPCEGKCGANGKGQKLLTTNSWQEYLPRIGSIRKTVSVLPVMSTGTVLPSIETV